MRTRLIVLGALSLLLVEVCYSIALQKYDVGTSDKSFFRGPFSSLLRATY